MFLSRLSWRRLDTAALLVLLTALLVASPVRAELLEDFDGGGNTAYSLTRSLFGDPPSVLPDGPSGSFLRLTHLSRGTSNSVAFDENDSVTGPAPNGKVLSFDFRMSDNAANTAAGGCCGSAADGFGIGYFATSRYGSTGPNNPNMSGNPWERPEYASAVTVGFDVFPNIDVVTLNGFGSVLAEVDIRPLLDLNDGVFHRGSLTVTPNPDDPAAALFDLDIIEDVFGDNPVTHSIMSDVPAEIDLAALPLNRVIAGGRTGSAYVATDIDNIRVDLIDDTLPPPVNGGADVLYTHHLVTHHLVDADIPESFLGAISTNSVTGSVVGSYGLPAPVVDPADRSKDIYTYAVSGAFGRDGTLYTIVQTLGDRPEESSSRLAVVDSSTGLATPFGATIDTNLVGMEMDDHDTIWATGFSEFPLASTPTVGFFGDTNLYRVDSKTGDTTLVGDTGVERLMDLAFDSSGTLWGTVANKLYTIDTDTGKATFQTDITGVVEAIPEDDLLSFQNFVEIMGIAFDANDTLYANTFTVEAGLFTIDTTSGAATFLGRTGVDLAHGGDIFLPPPLQAGDADQNLQFDQFDLVRVLQAAKYLTGEAATWGEGDWDGAPGGRAGNPPAGDGVFDQKDIVAAQQNGMYGAGGYAAILPHGVAGDAQTSVGYDAGSGEIWVDSPAGRELTSINIDSASGIFTGDAAQNLGGSFDNDADNNIFKATFGGSFGSMSFGNVAQVGLSEASLLNDLTVVGSLAGGGDLGQVDLVYVPEPTSALLLALGLGMGLVCVKRVGLGK